MSTWKQNSKEFEDSMVRDIVEGIDYRMKLEGMDTEVLKELEQVFGFGVLRICEISLMHASFSRYGKETFKHLSRLNWRNMLKNLEDFGIQ